MKDFARLVHCKSQWLVYSRRIESNGPPTMFDADQYELLDFGDGRKLERFGALVLDRPCPAAERTSRAAPAAWSKADWQYVRRGENKGSWNARVAKSKPPTWNIRHGDFELQLQLSEFGHLGVFPEQAENWSWIARQIQRCQRQLKVLNLFAYTGGSTLAAAAAGAEVVHVDSAANIVRRARQNAEISGLADAPIRWISEDAQKFVEREVRRGNKYDAIILDPPSYGHGPKGEVWKLAHHLMPLLSHGAMLVESQLAFLLFTCHSPGFGPAELQASLEDTFFGHCQTGAQARSLQLTTKDNRRLSAGCVARFPG